MDKTFDVHKKQFFLLELDSHKMERDFVISQIQFLPDIFIEKIWNCIFTAKISILYELKIGLFAHQ